jgi:4-amino-4-deoxy-L-arabinose transferase-like glycosyltransferase
MGAIVALGAVLRLVYKATSNQDLLTGLSGDGWFYQAAAQRLAEGMGFVSVLGETRPFAGFPPMWTSVLGLGAWLGADSIWSMRLIAIGVGLVTILLVGMAARQLGGSRAGLVAAGIAALYPGLWYYEWSLLSETLVHLGIALFLVLCYRFWAHPTALRAALVGGSVGLLALTRAEGLLLAPLVVVPLLLLARTAPVERRLGWLVLAGAVTLAMLTPWFAYNLGRFEEPVLLSNGLGTAMYVSNCDATYSGELLGYYANPGCPEEHRGRPGHVVSGDQSEQDRAKRRVAIDYATDHPQRLPVVVAARVGRSIGVYRPVQTMDFQVDWSLVPRWVGTWWMVGYGVVAAAAIPGLVRVRRSGLPVFPLVAFLVIVVAGSALTFGSIRYRAALEVPLVVLAGVGIDGLLRSRAERWPRRSGASPPLV